MIRNHACSLLRAGALVGVAALAFLLPIPALAVEQVSFPSNNAMDTKGAPTTIPATLMRPDGAGPFPALVLFHGCGGLYNSKGVLTARHKDWAERLVSQGFLVLLPDSFTPRGYKEVCTFPKQPVDPFLHRNRDAYGALVYLQSRPDVIPDRIGVLGWSHGGSTTLATVNKATVSRPAGLRTDFRAAVAFYPGCGKLSTDPKWGIKIPLLILIGEKDDWTPPEPCVALERTLKERGDPAELVLYPDSYHGFDTPNEPVKQRTGVNFNRGGSAMIGTNPAARADAIQRVTAYLAAKLKD